MLAFESQGHGAHFQRIIKVVFAESQGHGAHFQRIIKVVFAVEEMRVVVL
jgi:hypothetical protein